MDDQQAVRAAGVRVDIVAGGRAVLEALRHDAQDLLGGGHACADMTRVLSTAAYSVLVFKTAPHTAAWMSRLHMDAVHNGSVHC